MIFLDEQFVDADLTLRRGAHVNRDNFIDRAFVRTGIDIEVIEGPEENRLELIAVENALEGKVKLDKRNCLIIEVGSGSAEMMILNKGQVEFIRTLSIGSLRAFTAFVFAETFALVPSATAAIAFAPSIETHARPNSRARLFPSNQRARARTQ